MKRCYLVEMITIPNGGDHILTTPTTEPNKNAKVPTILHFPNNDRKKITN
jgi:hypothetical protein